MEKLVKLPWMQEAACHGLDTGGIRTAVQADGTNGGGTGGGTETNRRAHRARVQAETDRHVYIPGNVAHGLVFRDCMASVG